MKEYKNKQKYSYQMKYIKNNYKKFHIDFKFDVFNQFLDICKKNNTTPTTVIKKFVNDYIKNNL